MAMRYNTLQLVNKILNALDLQPVSTLGETEDAEQVLSIVDRVQTELELDLNWFPQRTTIALDTASGTSTTVENNTWMNNYPDIPWAMKIPTGVEAVYKVYYNQRLLTPMDPRSFLHRIEVGSALTNDSDPRFWTMGLVDENYIVLDKFDGDVETRLTTTNSSAYVTKYDQASLASDTDVLGLTEKFFATMLHRCISFGFNEIIKDIQKASWYNRQYEIAKNKTNIHSRRFKPHQFSLGDYDFSRKRRRGIFIDSSQYRDVSSQA